MKKCKYAKCQKKLKRKRYDCGRLENRKDFAKRLFCDPDCKAKHQILTWDMVEKYCQSKICGKRLIRKRYKNGNLEAGKLFQRRKYCDRDCERAEVSRRKISNWMTEDQLDVQDALNNWNAA